MIIIFIIFKQNNIKIEYYKRKILIYEVEFSGLANRLLGLSGCLVLSLMSQRRLFIYHYEHLQNYIEESQHFSIINSLNDKNYTNYKTVSDGYCGDLCKFFNSIIKSKKEGIIIRNVFDFISVMVKCRNLKDWFIMNKYISSTSEYDNNIISLEINHIIFSKLILLKTNIEKEVREYIKPYKNECKIGIQLREDDRCIIDNICKVNQVLMKNILKIVSKYNNKRKCVILFSSANKLLYKEISLQYSKTVTFMPNTNPSHSSIVHNNDTYKKTIGDIILPSIADYLIISEHSTYSKIILYKFLAKSKINNFVFVNRNGEININEPLTELIDNTQSRKCVNFPVF